MRPFALLALTCLTLAACNSSAPPFSAPHSLSAGRTSNSGSASPGTAR